MTVKRVYIGFVASPIQPRKKQMIEIKRDGTSLRITFPYDAELKDEIYALDKSQRRWDGSSWLVLENDPNQQPGEETNLKFVRRVTNECASRRNWKVYDLTMASSTQIEEQKLADKQTELELRVKAIVSVLPRLPKNSLKMVRWGSSTIRLQLTQFLDDKPLFDELYRDSQNVFKVQAVASFDAKQSFGFAFDLDNHPDVIEALLKIEGIQYFKKYDNVQIEKALPSGLIRLVNSQGTALLGIPIDSVDMSEIDYTSQAWEVAQLDSKTYWVTETEKFIRAWLEERHYNIASVGGVIRHITERRSSTLADIIRQWELEDWFGQWSQSLLLSEDFTYSCGGWNALQWNHPSDSLTRHLKRFGSDSLHSLIPDYDQLVDRLNQRKRDLVAERKEADRRNAPHLARGVLLRKYPTKTKLTEFASKRITVKKSWTIDRILAELCADQEFCLNIIGLKKEAVSQN